MIRLIQCAKSFGTHVVFDDLNLEIAAGEHLAIFAKSGYGKTTLLRMIAGLEKPTKGEITGCRPEQIAFMFQEARLFDSLSVLDNVAIVSPQPLKSAKPYAQALLDELGLASVGASFPPELSGGMKQRVALARTFLPNREILLLDEPFSALDEGTKIIARQFVEKHARGKTLLLVTHDPSDAAALCERVLKLDA